MNAIFLQTALRQTHTNLTNPRLYAVFGIVVLIFAISGPFGTLEAFSLPHRLGLWFLLHAFTWVTAIFSLNIFSRALANTLPNKWLHLTICAIFAGFPVSLVTMWIEPLLKSDHFQLSFENWLLALSTAVPLTLAFSILSNLAAGNESDEGIATPRPLPDTTVANTLAQPKLMARLPLEKRGDLISLSAADHYVEVVTTKGSSLILMRLADAVTETAPLEGRMIHRSHWVANTAIARVEGSIGKAKLYTVDGRYFPLSRAMTTKIRALLERAAQ